MPERTVVVGSTSGLHARPAALFVKAANAQHTKVRLRVGSGPAVDARSILGILALRVTQGTEVTLEADGDEAAQALDELGGLLEQNLDEEPEGA